MELRLPLEFGCREVQGEVMLIGDVETEELRGQGAGPGDLRELVGHISMVPCGCWGLLIRPFPHRPRLPLGFLAAS